MNLSTTTYKFRPDVSGHSILHQSEVCIKGMKESHPAAQWSSAGWSCASSKPTASTTFSDQLESSMGKECTDRRRADAEDDIAKDGGIRPTATAEAVSTGTTSNSPVAELPSAPANPWLDLAACSPITITWPGWIGDSSSDAVDSWLAPLRLSSPRLMSSWDVLVPPTYFLWLPWENA